MRAIGRNHLLLALCVSLLGGASVLAEDRPAPPDGRPNDGAHGPHPKPPEAAFTACSNLQEDDVCEVTLRDRTIEGKCVPARDESRLLCLPNHPPGPFNDHRTP